MVFGFKCSECDKIIELDKNQYVRIPESYKFLCSSCCKKLKVENDEQTYELKEKGFLVKTKGEY